MASPDLVATAAQTPALQALRRRVEAGGVLSCRDLASSAQPFVAVLLQHLFPQRPIVVVTDGLKTQETVHQDIETWTGPKDFKSQISNCKSFFYPASETLPHEAKLPHADIISERLETLVALTLYLSPAKPGEPRHGQPAPIIVASVVALLQRTFRPDLIRQ